jgi:hypothetical protein
VPSRKAFPLRLPPEVYEALRLWASDELRSVNAQVEFALVQALRRAGRWPRDPKAAPPDDAGPSSAESSD